MSNDNVKDFKACRCMLIIRIRRCLSFSVFVNEKISLNLFFGFSSVTFWIFQKWQRKNKLSSFILIQRWFYVYYHFSTDHHIIIGLVVCVWKNKNVLREWQVWEKLLLSSRDHHTQPKSEKMFENAPTFSTAKSLENDESELSRLQSSYAL
jgi:hypothetical protein